eukprot:CAMPEP_0179093922 /NCGR_PEP_ID=MMETSP0796-20121207/43045_1 /TAXON_ID=73915 /ORGANISM="Pyrodinium bahamense, Strain pbaha01" /LENGTH=52 /DNA_ID=CAMNT_0020791579 /DNA_START=706 /DNA_END=864 /DNA_ORIENTATION=-
MPPQLCNAASASEATLTDDALRPIRSKMLAGARVRLDEQAAPAETPLQGSCV